MEWEVGLAEVGERIESGGVGGDVRRLLGVVLRRAKEAGVGAGGGSGAEALRKVMRLATAAVAAPGRGDGVVSVRELGFVEALRMCRVEFALLWHAQWSAPSALLVEAWKKAELAVTERGAPILVVLDVEASPEIRVLARARGVTAFPVVDVFVNDPTGAPPTRWVGFDAARLIAAAGTLNLRTPASSEAAEEEAPPPLLAPSAAAAAPPSPPQNQVPPQEQEQQQTQRWTLTLRTPPPLDESDVPLVLPRGAASTVADLLHALASVSEGASWELLAPNNVPLRLAPDTLLSSGLNLADNAVVEAAGVWRPITINFVRAGSADTSSRPSVRLPRNDASVFRLRRSARELFQLIPRLVFNGRMLSNDRQTMDEAGVPDGSSVMVVAGGKPINEEDAPPPRAPLGVRLPLALSSSVAPTPPTTTTTTTTNPLLAHVRLTASSARFVASVHALVTSPNGFLTDATSLIESTPSLTAAASPLRSDLLRLTAAVSVATAATNEGGAFPNLSATLTPDTRRRAKDIFDTINKAA